jgi:integrase
MALTETAVRKARADGKERKLFDGGGLYLLLTPSGGKLWRLKYRFADKEKKLALGQWPEVSLADARALRDEARKVLASSGDPSLEKKKKKARLMREANNTFAALSSEYLAHKKNNTGKHWAPATAKRNENLLSLLTLAFGSLPVSAIQPPDILKVLRRIEASGRLESARRALQLAGAVFRYGVATGRLDSDPARDLKGALVSPKVKHHAAIVDPVKFGGLLRAIDSYEGDPVTRYALQLLPHVFVRPGELRHARWEEFDFFDTAVWTIPAERTKLRRPHAVPLSGQAIDILARLQALRRSTGPLEGYVFPSIRTPARPISDNTLNAALRRLGYAHEEMTAHGFRATASTLLNESGLWHPDAIERALAHGDSNAVRGTYARGQFWAERERMAQWWSDHLDELRKGVKAVTFLRAA